MSTLSGMNQISKVTMDLYIGSVDCVTREKLRQLGITLVINCAREITVGKIPGVDIVKLDIDDLPSSKIDIYFNHCCDLIKCTKDRGGRALVHCAAGISRSATICLSYLMKNHDMSLKRAYSHLKLRRPIIRPNVGFFRQLMEFEKRLHGTTTVTMVRSRAGLIPDVYMDEISSGMLYFPSPITPPSLPISNRHSHTSLPTCSHAYRRWR